MNIFEIVLANNDRLACKTEMSFEDFKKYLSENSFIEIERSHPHQIGNTTYFRPGKAYYQTKSIVYINDETEFWEEAKQREDKIKSEQQPLIEKIKSYQFNKRMKFWFFWHCKFYFDKETCKELNFNPEFLQNIIDKCKKYKCKLISE